MNKLLELSYAPLSAFNIPRFKFTIPSIRKVDPMVIFVLVLISYYLVTSGIIYDIIVEPPSVGSTRVGGATKPTAFLQWRINGQFINEGLSAGFLFFLGGISVIFLDLCFNPTTSNTSRYILSISGVLFFTIAYKLLIVFMSHKLPSYMHEESYD